MGPERHAVGSAVITARIPIGAGVEAPLLVLDPCLDSYRSCLMRLMCLLEALGERG